MFFKCSPGSFNVQPSVRTLATESVVGGLSALAVPGSLLEMEHLRPHPYSETHWLRFCIFTGNVWSVCTAKFEKQYFKPSWVGFSVLSTSTATIFNRSAGPTYLNTVHIFKSYWNDSFKGDPSTFPNTESTVAMSHKADHAHTYSTGISHHGTHSWENLTCAQENKHGNGLCN